jgi:hypothetical protein
LVTEVRIRAIGCLKNVYLLFAFEVFPWRLMFNINRVQTFSLFESDSCISVSVAVMQTRRIKMKNTMISIVMGVLVFASFASADQSSILTCKGKNITLTTKTPYLGEQFHNPNRTLYILKALDNKHESNNTAYFLDVDVEGDVDSHHMIWTVGRNKLGEKFTLKTQFWKDVGDGTTVHEVTTGLLSYNFGHFKGLDEVVKCDRQ